MNLPTQSPHDIQEPCHTEGSVDEYPEGAYSKFENGLRNLQEMSKLEKTKFLAENGHTDYQNMLAGTILSSDDHPERVPFALKWLFISMVLGDRYQEPTHSLLYSSASELQIERCNQLVDAWFESKFGDSTQIDKSAWSANLRKFFVKDRD